MAKKTTTLPQYLWERYEKAKQQGIARHYSASAPKLLEAHNSDEFTGNKNGKYQGRTSFFLPGYTETVLFEYDPEREVWRVTHDWND